MQLKTILQQVPDPRGKPNQKIVVACARELAGFVWAIATDQPLRQS